MVGQRHSTAKVGGWLGGGAIKQRLTGFGCVVILTRDVEFNSDSVGDFGYVCYRIEGFN